ncbi:MAG: FHA domain-containing protein [Acidobacteriaceae bacterium]|nr:FHA domain-containing protein [Acidobacteriaceae bacterium]
MKSLDQLDSWIAAKVRSWSSRIAGAPRGGKLLEIRRDILNDVRDHIQPRGEGKSVFPYNTVSVRITAEDAAQQALFEQAFAEDDDLRESVAALLLEAGCALPAAFVTNVSVFEGAAAEFYIDYSNAKAAPSVSAAPNIRPAAKLTVIGGQADPSEFVIDADRVNIGRLKEVASDKDGLRRRNDIAFADTETTVSREHAFIRYHPETGKFRLYDSMSQRGASVFREGRRFQVPKGPAHGFLLRSGDEIHLGSARLRFEMEKGSL